MEIRTEHWPSGRPFEDGPIVTRRPMTKSEEAEWKAEVEALRAEEAAVLAKAEKEGW